MYACLFGGEPAALYALAQEFSPVLEQTASGAVLFSIAPLRRLLGSPHQIAAEIARAGDERKLQANLAIAANPDAALLLATHFPGITLVTPGEEHRKLASIPLSALVSPNQPADEALLDVFHRWGLKTCEDLAAMPAHGLAERLGARGVYWRNLARGCIERPLHLSEPVPSYQERVELEHPLDRLEPLLFLFSRTLGELCRRLRAQSRAARLLAALLELADPKAPYRCELEFPVPVDDSRTLLKLLQLHLERHAPPDAVVAFTLRIEPVEPRRVQGGLFVPPSPPPDKLQVTLARIAGLVGKENVGVPVLLDTYRPDAFEMNPLPELGQPGLPTTPQPALQLVVRLFRPALPARVRLAASAPRTLAAPGIQGNVLRSAGPWKTSGEWWASTGWRREEWDVALDDGALYRIYQDDQNGSWFVHGVYD